jgi:hypothetical protein
MFIGHTHPAFIVGGSWSMYQNIVETLNAKRTGGRTKSKDTSAPLRAASVSTLNNTTAQQTSSEYMLLHLLTYLFRSPRVS